MAKSPIKIAYVLVDSGRDYRTEARADESRRIDCLMKTVAAVKAAGEDVSLLTFPAGYFQRASASDLPAFAESISKRLASMKPSFGIVWGMDVSGKKLRSKSELANEGGHPYFVAYRGPGRGEFVIHHQVSVTAKEGNSAEAIGRWGSRDALLPGTSIALLICGECWSDELYDRASANCRALIIAAHRNVNMHKEANGYGKLSWHRRLEALRRQKNIPTVLSEHTRSPTRHPYAWPASIAKPWPLPDVPETITLRLATIR